MPRNFSTIGCTSKRIRFTALLVSSWVPKYFSLRFVALGRQCACLLRMSLIASITLYSVSEMKLFLSNHSHFSWKLA